jgi:hypothetical protein
MTQEGSGWVDLDSHGWVRTPTTEAEWEELVADYGGDVAVSAPFRRAIEVVRENGCVSVVIENRYVDADYRSEFAAFWAHRFADRSAFARRLHFFSAEVAAGQLHDLPDATRDGYLGYVVCRPVPLGAVGRTVLKPPASMSGGVMTTIDDVVTLFGNRLHVRGAPFCQQDTEFLRCAHAAAWMCHYTAARRGLVARRLTAAFVDASPGLLSLHRALPSKGLTPLQVQAVFGSMGQPALALDFNQLPQVQGVKNPTPLSDNDGNPLPGSLWDTRMFSIICRYLNSGFPVFIGTENHAFTVVGWGREGTETRFYVNDDARGPYLKIDSPFTDIPRMPWLLMMVPLPRKVFLSAESAENFGYTILTGLAAVPALAQLAADVSASNVCLRTFLLDASDYKASLSDRGVDPAVARGLKLARLPHHIWVVEAHVKAKCSSDEPCVVAEVILDSTSHDARPRQDAMIAPGFALTFPPGGKPTGITNTVAAWRSHLDSVGAAH